MVRDKLEELGFKYKKVNVKRDLEDPQRVKLVKKTGISTVPVIDIDGEFTGESDVIIKKLEKLAG